MYTYVCLTYVEFMIYACECEQWAVSYHVFHYYENNKIIHYIVITLHKLLLCEESN